MAAKSEEQGIVINTLKSGNRLVTIDNDVYTSLESIIEIMERYVDLYPDAYLRIKWNAERKNKVKREMRNYFNDHGTFLLFNSKFIPHAGSLEHLSASIDKVIYPFISNLPKKAPFITNSNKRNVSIVIKALLDAHYTSHRSVIHQDPIYGFLGKWIGIETYESGRTKTDLPFIKNKKPIKTKESVTRIAFEGYEEHPHLSKVYVDANGAIYLPVIRYQYGMTRGGYYSEESENKSWCGTFYYYEKEASTLLYAKTYTVFRNKYDAFYQLKKLVPVHTIYERLQQLGEEVETLKAYSHYHPLFSDEYTSNVINFFMEVMLGTRIKTLETYHKAKMLFNDYALRGKKVYLTPSVYADPEIGSLVDEITQSKRYITQAYADEDRFDQAICFLAKDLGIECIILTHMAGKTRIVSEVLDTRNRQESFNSIFIKSH